MVTTRLHGTVLALKNGVRPLPSTRSQVGETHQASKSYRLAGERRSILSTRLRRMFSRPRYIGALQMKTVSVPPRHDTPITCKYTPIYNKNVLLPTANVVLCCTDYGLKHTIGNLYNQAYEEIFVGRHRPPDRSFHAKRMRQLLLCCRYEPNNANPLWRARNAGRGNPHAVATGGRATERGGLSAEALCLKAKPLLEAFIFA